MCYITYYIAVQKGGDYGMSFEDAKIITEDTVKRVIRVRGQRDCDCDCACELYDSALECNDC